MQIASNFFLSKQTLTVYANCLWQYMQIVSLGDNLKEMSIPIFWEK